MMVELRHEEAAREQFQVKGKRESPSDWVQYPDKRQRLLLPTGYR